MTDTPEKAADTARPDAKSKLVSVVAAKAFLGPDGWVQIGQKADVTPERKRDLARNGLIEGANRDADDDGGQTSTPVDAPRQTRRRLHVGGGGKA